MMVFKNAWFTRFARKEKITAKMLLEAVERAEKGLIDADLGGGVIKQRMARPGQGKSKGFRTILLFRQDERCFFVFGYAKSELENISEHEETQFKLMANFVLNLTDEQLAKLVEKGQFEKVREDVKKIP